MVTQKAISARIYKDLLEEIDLEVSITGVPRNALINIALRWYLEYVDKKRKRSIGLAND